MPSKTKITLKDLQDKLLKKWTVRELAAHYKVNRISVYKALIRLNAMKCKKCGTINF